MQTAYSYIRFSNAGQIKGDSRRRQLDMAKAYAARHDLYLDEDLSFQDLGVSAYKGDNFDSGRLGDFLMAVKRGFVANDSYLLVENLDRVSRDCARRALRVLEDICDEGITVVTLMDNQVYTADRLDNDPVALFISLVIFMRANEESRTRAMRQKEAWNRKFEVARKTGKLITKKLPSWLRLDGNKVVIVPEHAKVVRDIFDLAALGIGKDAITAKLNRDKVPTFLWAKHWTHTRVREILTGPAAIGTFVPRARRGGGIEPIENYYPAVIDRALFDEVQTILDRRRQRWSGSPRKRELRNIFARLARCPLCGGSMSRNYKSYYDKGIASIPHFICRLALSGGDCDYVAIPYDPIEEQFRQEGPALVEKQIDAMDGGDPAYEARMSELEEFMRSGNNDVALLNQRLRRALTDIIIDHPHNQVVLNWRRGDPSTMGTDMEVRSLSRNRFAQP